MKVYLSHSYRDIAVNGYFLERFIDDEVTLFADQKTDVWCVAKLERYLGELDGFVSIVTHRPNPDGTSGFSPYIGQELQLARRAQIPRLLFVDQRVLRRHRLEFPPDAVAFDAEQPDSAVHDHRDAIERFRQQLEVALRRRTDVVARHACIVTASSKSMRSVAEDVAEVLKRQEFTVELFGGRRPGRGLDDIRILEALRTAELSVFLLPQRLSDVHVALAMAHAEFAPSIRLQVASDATDIEPDVSGLIPWTNADDMLVELTRQVASYREGLVLPVEQARATSPAVAARSIGTMRWNPRDDNLWDVASAQDLLLHVRVDHRFVRDEIARASATYGHPLGTARGREAGREVCASLYDGLRRHRFAYEIEMATGEVGHQAIRSPAQIESHRTATCLDIVLLFASMLAAAGHRPLVVIVDGPTFAHALAGYRVPGEPSWDQQGLGDLRGAVARGDAVLFEATGALESDEPVGAEEPLLRRNRTFGFADAVLAAGAMLNRGDLVLRHFVDVHAMRDR